MIRVGPAGWSYPDWDGRVYPRRKGAGFHPLRHLARYVDCIEINSCFYATPRAEHAERWAAEVAGHPAFRFTAKLQKVFTHGELPAREGELAALVESYSRGLAPLRAAGRLAAVLAQFPVSFAWSPASLRRLERIAEALASLPLVLEVRHRSFFAREPLEWIERLGFSLAAIDLPPARDHPPRDVPAIGPIGYLRLHGRNAEAWFDPRSTRDRRYDYLYGPDELAEIARRTRRLATGRDDTYLITNNHFSGKALANALELLAELRSAPPRAPLSLIEAFPRLREGTRPDGQIPLF